MREIGALLELVPRDINGIALMRAILKIAGVPVIFLSAYGQDETIARVVEMGTWTTWSSPSPRRSSRRG